MPNDFCSILTEKLREDDYKWLILDIWLNKKGNPERFPLLTT